MYYLEVSPTKAKRIYFQIHVSKIEVLDKNSATQILLLSPSRALLFNKLVSV